MGSGVSTGRRVPDGAFGQSLPSRSSDSDSMANPVPVAPGIHLGGQSPRRSSQTRPGRARRYPPALRTDRLGPVPSATVGPMMWSLTIPTTWTRSTKRGAAPPWFTSRCTFGRAVTAMTGSFREGILIIHPMRTSISGGYDPSMSGLHPNTTSMDGSAWTLPGRPGSRPFTCSRCSPVPLPGRSQDRPVRPVPSRDCPIEDCDRLAGQWRLYMFRLIDYLSVGICIVGPPHRTELPVSLVDRRHIILCGPDLSDLVSLCQQYLEDDTARRQVARNVREYFDRYLHRDQLSSFYLLQLFKKLNSLN